MFNDWAANMWKGHSLRKSICKNSLAVTVYIIWQEHNTRIFEETSKDPGTSLNSIYNLISDRIVICGGRVTRDILVQWDLVNQIAALIPLCFGQVLE